MKWATAIVAVTLAAPSARADGALPFSFVKQVPATRRIETQQPHPDYVVVIYRHGLQFNESTKGGTNTMRPSSPI